MTLAKAVVTGIVYKPAKTGYTQNNVAVSSFVLNVGEGEETLVRVISKRQSLASIVESLTKNQKVLVGGRLQTGVSKLDDGTEKKVFEIEASSIELMEGSSEVSSSSSYSQEGDILSFGEMESSAESADALMSEEEVPF
ncbi:single-stranded DNA-binding protein [bacterium]|nr:single-stranded DNA-binding protein [bacterium]